MSDLGSLERRLASLAPEIEWPEPRPMSAAVRARLAPRATRPRRRWALAMAAALVLAVAGLLALSPPARDTVAGWIGIRGVRLEHVPVAPSPAPLPSGGPGQSLGLGDQVRLEQVQNPSLRRVPAALGPPDEVYRRTVNGADVVSLVYVPQTGLPKDANTGVGALVVEIQGSLTDYSFAKGLPPGTHVDQVRVRGGTGYWITGQPHAFIILSGGGSDELRLAGNVLIWTENGVTYRIESQLGQERALAVATSMG